MAFLSEMPAETVIPRARNSKGHTHNDPCADDRARDHLVGASSENLIDRLPRKAITSVPKLASWTPFAFVVDSFLMRAADYGVRHRDR